MEEERRSDGRVERRSEDEMSVDDTSTDDSSQVDSFHSSSSVVVEVEEGVAPLMEDVEKYSS